MGFLVDHELRRVGELAITYVTGEEGVAQYALFIFCWVVQLQVTHLALVIAEDDVALEALQGDFRC